MKKKKNILVIKNIHLLLPSYSSLLQSHSLLAHHFSSVFLFFFFLSKTKHPWTVPPLAHPLVSVFLSISQQLTTFFLLLATLSHPALTPLFFFQAALLLVQQISPSSTTTLTRCDVLIFHMFHTTSTHPRRRQLFPGILKKKKNSWSTKGSTHIQPLSLLILNFYLFNFITSISKGS